MEEERATQLIEDLDGELIQYVQNRLKEKLKRKPRPEGTYRGASIHVFGDAGIGYISLVKDSEVVYFVKHQTVRHNGFQLGRQVLVWRQEGIYEAAGFSNEVFFKKLLPKYSALIADQLQTRQGKQFWLFALGKAFEQNLYVYFLDRRSTPNQLIRLESEKDLSEYSSKIWGHSEGHKRTFAVISLKPLALRRRSQ